MLYGQRTVNRRGSLKRLAMAMLPKLLLQALESKEAFAPDQSRMTKRETAKWELRCFRKMTMACAVGLIHFAGFRSDGQDVSGGTQLSKGSVNKS